MFCLFTMQNKCLRIFTAIVITTEFVELDIFLFLKHGLNRKTFKESQVQWLEHQTDNLIIITNFKWRAENIYRLAWW